MLRLGVHPTIAGVVVGLMVPIKSWFGRDRFLQIARSALDDFQKRAHQADVDERELVEPLNLLAQARKEALSPAKRIETALHPWVAFVIMPVFALANAGVHLAGLDFTVPGATAAMMGVGIGLVVGKCVGIVGFSWISVRLGLCVLPPGVTWKGLFVIGAAGGIGFTMAIFIAELAFAQSPLLNPAKLAVLIGTGVAGTVALVSGAMFLRPPGGEEPQPTESDLEASAEYWTMGTTPTREGFGARM